MPKEFTLGIEEELQIIDPRTRELKSPIEECWPWGRTWATGSSRGSTAA